jgi:hypothetical protein
MLKEFYDKYGFVILFSISILILIGILVYNWYYGKVGSYQDHTRLMWNIFASPVNDIKPAHPVESKGEIECRRVAERLTQKPFPKHRPSFLKNTVTDANLELDCFCDELKLGIEYNGRQHYEYTPYFHKSKDAFYNAKYRDEMKNRLCAQNGVRLIVVPYTIPINEIEAFLTKEFRALSII